MDKRAAVLDGALSFASLMVAVMGAAEPLAGVYPALFLAFLTGIYGAPCLVLAHKISRVDLAHALAAYAALASVGLALFWLDNPLGAWAALIYALLLAAPFLAGRTGPFGRRPGSRGRALDARLLSLARRHGGILTRSLVVEELRLSLEEADVLLAKFYRHGEAKAVEKGPITFYIFPGVLASPGGPEVKVLEALMECPRGATWQELLAKTGLEAWELDKALKSLEGSGAIRFFLRSGEYKLSCLSRRPRSRHPHGRKARRSRRPPGAQGLRAPAGLSPGQKTRWVPG